MTEIVCTLPEDQKRVRSEELRRGLLGRVRERRDLENGVALRFPMESEEEVEEFVRFEERCCSFATWETRRGGPSRVASPVSVRVSF